MRYYEIAHGQHFDAFLGLPGFGSAFVPMQPYLLAAMDLMAARLAAGRAAAAEPGVTLRPRAALDGGSLSRCPVESGGAIRPWPGAGDRITLRRGADRAGLNRRTGLHAKKNEAGILDVEPDRVCCSALALLVWMTMRGMELLVAALLCALLALSRAWRCSRSSPPAGALSYTAAYVGGLVGFAQSWFLHVPARLAVRQGGGERRGRFGRELDRRRIGAPRDGGGGARPRGADLRRRQPVRGRVLGLPDGLSLFRVADLPRRFIPAAFAFGSVTFSR